ncbi:hypothetical protein BDK51DRAFT_43928 [Blyttiomyces helicus]|uniref:Uncharacterized protein n=1 Tax=Blyttiomyces helicus TaxID=388810 RepID=A0A4P9WIK5_9FUNG|nr:hypothetical protein BDK51DRAFT_43928 [Blyttiomyces helicus]|eukprot:RKO92701.1 hypothetical protein BDK51DRAFT_43928 [Blyttiomyces helicus]
MPGSGMNPEVARARDAAKLSFLSLKRQVDHGYEPTFTASLFYMNQHTIRCCPREMPRRRNEAPHEEGEEKAWAKSRRFGFASRLALGEVPVKRIPLADPVQQPEYSTNLFDVSRHAVFVVQGCAFRPYLPSRGTGCVETEKAAVGERKRSWRDDPANLVPMHSNSGPLSKNADKAGSSLHQRSISTEARLCDWSQSKFPTSQHFPMPVRLHVNLLLLRTQSPAAYAFWTEHFGDQMEVSKTVFRAALARFGRHEVHIGAKYMNTRVFRAPVLRKGPLGNMFASVPESGAIENSRLGNFADIPVDADPGSGIIRVGGNLKKCTSSSGEILRKSTIWHLDAKLTVLRKRVVHLFLATQARRTPIREPFLGPEPSFRSEFTVRVKSALEIFFVKLVIQPHYLLPRTQRKVSPVRLTFCDDLEIPRIENPAAHRFSNFQYATNCGRRQFRGALRLLGIHIDLKSHVGKKGDITPSALRKMIACEGSLAAAFPCAEPCQPDLLKSDRSFPGPTPNPLVLIQAVKDSRCATATGESNPSPAIKSGTPLEVARPSGRGHGLEACSWQCSNVISLATKAVWRNISDALMKRSDAVDKELNISPAPEGAIKPKVVCGRAAADPSESRTKNKSLWRDGGRRGYLIVALTSGLKVIRRGNGVDTDERMIGTTPTSSACRRDRLRTGGPCIIRRESRHRRAELGQGFGDVIVPTDEQLSTCLG